MESTRSVFGPGVLACVGAVALLAGCATSAPGRLADDPDVRRASEGWEPLPYTVLVALPEVEAPSSEPGPKAHPLPVDEGRIGEIVLRSIRENAVFRETLEPEEGEAAFPEKLLTSARDRDAALLLEFTLERIECRPLGRNSLWLPNLVLWLTLWAPSLWVADQTYEVEAEAAYRMRNTEDGEVVYRGSLLASSRVDLDYIDRDVAWWGLFRMEDGDLNWQAIITRVRPHALHALEKAFAISLLQEFGPVARDETFRRRVFPGQSTAPEVAVVIGVSEYDVPSLQERCRFAHNDAIGVRDFLTERRDGELSEEGLEMLVGEAASREKIAGAFFKLISDGTQHRQRVSVYFSGLGASGTGPEGRREFYLLPSDADPDDLDRTAISLGQIAEWLGRARADEIILIVDAGFGSTEFGKGVLRASRPEAREVEAFKRAVREMLPGDGRAVIFAGLPGDNVGELPQDGHGLLTYYLLRYLGTKGDRDKDGSVTLGEIAERVPGKVLEEAALAGRTQTPLVFGDEKLVVNRP